jgi:hypothetical protein
VVVVLGSALAGPGTAADEGAMLGEEIVAFVRSRMGQRVGGGECSDLVVAALEAGGAWVPRGGGGGGEGLDWGDRVEKRSELRPGDVIEFREVVFIGRRRTTRGVEIYRTEFPQHVAIVERVMDRGRRLVIVHQNAGPATGSEAERRVVRRDTLVMGDLRPGGVMRFYRPRRGTVASPWGHEAGEVD